MAAFRMGRGGRARPIHTRQVRMHTVACRVCRRFCGESLAPYLAQSHESAQEAGWVEIEGEWGVCPECKKSADEAGGKTV
jgi:hypothetical protein